VSKSKYYNEGFNRNEMNEKEEDFVNKTN